MSRSPTPRTSSTKTWETTGRSSRASTPEAGTRATRRERAAPATGPVRVRPAPRSPNSQATTVLVGVLSDTHGKLDPAIVELFAGCDHIVHAGDVEDRAILERLTALAPVTAVHGNDVEGTCAGLPECATVVFDGFSLHVRHDLVMIEASTRPSLPRCTTPGVGWSSPDTPMCPISVARTGSSTSIQGRRACPAAGWPVRSRCCASKAVSAQRRSMSSGATHCRSGGRRRVDVGASPRGSATASRRERQEGQRRGSRYRTVKLAPLPPGGSASTASPARMAALMAAQHDGIRWSGPG